jgi:hypothetical protein
LQSINQDQISISPFGGSLDYMKAKKQQDVEQPLK